MDIVHGKVCERYGIDGFLIINPSWEARYEGLLDGLLTHENDGTITSEQNIRLLRDLLDPATVLTVRAHRGLNTPETVLLAARAGADLTKINLVYGSLGAGTDPERLAVDGVEAMRIAAKAGMGFDIPGNDELSGVPAWKTLAGLLITAAILLRPAHRPAWSNVEEFHRLQRRQGACAAVDHGRADLAGRADRIHDPDGGPRSGREREFLPCRACRHGRRRSDHRRIDGRGLLARSDLAGRADRFHSCRHGRVPIRR
jgi:hypothetical protein